MKKILITILAVLALQGINAQDDAYRDNELQTLFDGNTRISGFGGPMMSFTTMNGQFAHMMGGGGGVLLGDFFFGGYGEGLTTNVESGANQLDFGHGGFWTGYSFMANRALHPCLSAQIGWGSVSESDYDFADLSTDNIFVFNPALELEMNFARFFRLGVGVHYRIVTGVNPDRHNTPITNSDLSGPGAMLSFKFGWY
jgi:hypothetical protein